MTTEFNDKLPLEMWQQIFSHMDTESLSKSRMLSRDAVQIASPLLATRFKQLLNDYQILWQDDQIRVYYEPDSRHAFVLKDGILIEGYQSPVEVPVRVEWTAQRIVLTLNSLLTEAQVRELVRLNHYEYVGFTCRNGQTQIQVAALVDHRRTLTSYVFFYDCVFKVGDGMMQIEYKHIALVPGFSEEALANLLPGQRVSSLPSIGNWKSIFKYPFTMMYASMPKVTDARADTDRDRIGLHVRAQIPLASHWIKKDGRYHVYHDKAPEDIPSSTLMILFYGRKLGVQQLELGHFVSEHPPVSPSLPQVLSMPAFIYDLNIVRGPQASVLLKWSETRHNIDPASIVERFRTNKIGSVTMTDNNRILAATPHFLVNFWRLFR